MSLKTMQMNIEHLSLNSKSQKQQCRSSPHNTSFQAIQVRTVTIIVTIWQSEQRILLWWPIVYVPIFFAEPANANIIYLNMLEMLLWPQLREDFPGCLLIHHNRSPRHYHFKVRRFRDEQLPRSWRGQGDSTPWLPWSPDLTTTDLFIWGTSETMHMHHICHNPWNRYSDNSDTPH